MIQILANFFLTAILVFSVSAAADEYEDSIVKELNLFLSTQYDLNQPNSPVELVKHWQQIKHIHALAFYYKDDRALFDRTNAAPHMLHKWADVVMPFKMKNHDDPVVAVLANMIRSYKYMLRDRLNSGQGHTYREIADLSKSAGKKLALLIDQKYANGKLIPPEKNPWL